MRAIGNGSRLSLIVKKIREMREERQQRKKVNEKILPVKKHKEMAGSTVFGVSITTLQLMNHNRLHVKFPIQRSCCIFL